MKRWNAGRSCLVVKCLRGTTKQAQMKFQSCDYCNLFKQIQLIFLTARQHASIWCCGPDRMWSFAIIFCIGARSVDLWATLMMRNNAAISNNQKRSRGQMARRLATNQKIVGSIPTVTFLFAFLTFLRCATLKAISAWVFDDIIFCLWEWIGPC